MNLGAFAIAALLVVAGCKQLEQNNQCTCGTSDTPSSLSCDKRGFCEGNFDVVGHSDLGARGMNAAIAIAGNYAYIGSRTDGMTHQDAGVLIADISDPSQPKVVGAIGPPDEAVLGLSSRELRAVPDLHLLYVLNIICSVGGTDCSRNLNQFPNTGGIAETENLKIFDITDPIHPKLVGKYDFGNQPDSHPYVPPHEFYLWRDPNDPARVIIYVSLLFGPPSLEVIDATNPASPTLLTSWDAFEDAMLTDGEDRSTGDESLHSMSVSDDGKIVYVAHFGAGFFELDSSNIANASAPTRDLSLITPINARLDYSPPFYPGTHSALPIPGRPLVLLTDEVYPYDAGGNGCPWGWAWMVDDSDPACPTFFETRDRDTGTLTIHGQMRLPFNEASRCPPDAQQDRVTYTAHNPTVTPNLVILTWYGGGVQAMDISDPVNPKQVGAFYPEAIPSVALEDPALNGTTTEMWSYPIFRNGLIYVVDIRNGLYVLRYNGPHADEVTAQPFLEGNSNVR